MYLPAFPAIEASLAAGSGSAQITLATWFAGLAVGQLTQGSLADRFGRRRPLLFATALYTIASAGCALSPNLATLSACAFSPVSAARPAWSSPAPSSVTSLTATTPPA